MELNFNHQEAMTTPPSTAQGKKEYEEMFWDELPFQSELHAFTSRRSPYQVRFCCRGITRDKTQKLAKDIQDLVHVFICKHGKEYQ